ncbi:MAG: response regulator transcription factor [Clostridiaceae bacterium]|jgi:DNA-binding NarL/FixJ family response regulator|nr:response regulator transcription factor [Clostridiaceae bacterium]
MIRILIADDEKLLRESLKSIIETDAEIKVEGCAENGAEAFRLSKELAPDVILMDVRMPECDGIEGTRLIKQFDRNIKVVMLTTFGDEESISRAVENGADGYVLKDVTPDELKNVIKNAAHGFLVFSGKAGGTLRRGFSLQDRMTKDGQKQDVSALLKESELEILRLIAEGKSNKEIAEKVFLSEGRVKNIISEILTKLSLKDRYQLLSFAYRNNLIS